MTREEQIRNAIDTIIPILPSEEGRTYEQALMATGLEEGIRWADKNPNLQNIAEYLYKEKGYPISLNGEIPTFEETMKDVQTYNNYKAKQWFEKACKWLEQHQEDYDMYDTWKEYYTDFKSLIIDFRKAMEQ